MYVRKRQWSHYLGIIFLIKTMISVFLCVEITTLQFLKFSITATLYVFMSLPCMTSPSFTLRIFIGWFMNKHRKYSRMNVCILLSCFRYLLSFIWLLSWFRLSHSNFEIWYIFQIHLQKRICFTLTLSYLGNVSFATITMAVNSP